MEIAIVVFILYLAFAGAFYIIIREGVVAGEVSNKAAIFVAATWWVWIGWYAADLAYNKFKK